MINIREYFGKMISSAYGSKQTKVQEETIEPIAAKDTVYRRNLDSVCREGVNNLSLDESIVLRYADVRGTYIKMHSTDLDAFNRYVKSILTYVKTGEVKRRYVDEVASDRDCFQYLVLEHAVETVGKRIEETKRTLKTLLETEFHKDALGSVVDRMVAPLLMDIKELQLFFSSISHLEVEG